MINTRRYLNKRLLCLLLCAVFLAAFNFSVLGKEKLLSTGDVLVLKLAPVDPRSLMQGDYMALGFAEAGSMAWAAQQWLNVEGQTAGAETNFTAVMRKDDRGVYRFARLYAGESLAPEEHLLKFKFRTSGAVIGGGSFFFEEGSAKRYERAEYASLRVAPDGTALITALLYEDLQPIE